MDVRDQNTQQQENGTTADAEGIATRRNNRTMGGSKYTSHR